MKGFVAASCCLIVGLEILIGVPLAVCLGFLFLGSEAVSNVYVSEAQFAVPTCPPPIYSAPQFPVTPYAPAYGPATSPVADCPAPLAPAVVASLPASDPAAQPLPSLVSVNVRQAANEPQFLATVCADVSCPSAQPEAEECGAERSGESKLVESLHASAALLYQHAERHEADQEYSLADRLRSLARDLRDEAGSVSRRSPICEPAPVESGPPAPVSEPRTVTVGPPPLG